MQGWHNRPGVAAVPIASQTKLKKNSLYDHWISRNNRICPMNDTFEKDSATPILARKDKNS
jgi:hypothetical protein